jgi:signal transduction histidine kinase
LTLAAPINSGGAVIGRLDQTAISNFFRQINSTEQHRIKLLDSQRRIVYRSNSPDAYIGTQISSSALFEALGDRRDVVIGEETSPVDGIQRVYGAAHVGSTGYVLTIGVPLDSLYVPARRQLFFHSLLIMVALGCTVLAALFIARDIGQPLRVLARAAFRFGKGDLSARAALEGRDEIAELGATFNTMAASTAEREAKLKEVDRLKSEFVSSVSHELRTPLTTIKMLTRLMLRGGMSEEEQLECLENISSECDRQIDLVLNLLDLTRIESGAFNFSLSSVDPVEVVRACVRTQNQTARFAGHELFEELPSVLPYVKTDRNVLRRILCSLIENAIKYTPGGGRITLGARATGNEVSFYVSDTGVGIPREDTAHIFEKFYRGKSSGVCDGDVSSDQSAVAGVGLGLYLAKKLIGQLGGRIYVISEVGHGSTFTVAVPVWVNEDDSEFRIAEEENEKALARYR